MRDGHHDRTLVRIDRATSVTDFATFRSINEDWIGRLFSLTEADHLVLDDPAGQVVARGGDVLVARLGRASDVIGCVALLAHPDHVIELSKMGVTAAAQGHGVGRALVAVAVDRARQLGAERLFLGTNARLGPAIHIYEQAGFERIPLTQVPVAGYYARADVLMQLDLGTGSV